MDYFGVALLPMAEEMYADDYAPTGDAAVNASTLSTLCKHGPIYCFFPEPDQSIYVCKGKGEDEELSHCEFFACGHDVQFTCRARYLFFFLGSKGCLEAWIEPMVEKWTDVVQTLAKIAKHFPQTAYAGLAVSLQNEWQHVSSATPNVWRLAWSGRETSHPWSTQSMGCREKRLVRQRKRWPLTSRQSGVAIVARCVDVCRLKSSQWPCHDGR